MIGRGTEIHYASKLGEAEKNLNVEGDKATSPLISLEFTLNDNIDPWCCFSASALGLGGSLWSVL